MYRSGKVVWPFYCCDPGWSVLSMYRKIYSHANSIRVMMMMMMMMMHLCLRPPTTTTTTTTPPNHPPPHHPTTHPPTHPFGTSACFITDVFVVLLKTKIKMPNGWRTINSLVHKIRLHGRRGKGMAESFSRQKSRHAPQKEGGLKILCDLPPV